MAQPAFLAALGSLALLVSGSSFGQETAPVSQPQAVAVPFLYQIDGNGTSAFLYGTVHLPDKRVVSLPNSVAAAFLESDRFYAEIEATTESETKVQAMAQLPKDTSLPELVGPDTWSRIEARFIKAGQPAAFARMLGTMEPWAFSSLLPMLDYLEALATQPALDKMLYQRAVASGKAVAGLETVEEQVSVFESFSRSEQIQMLRDSLDLLDEYEASGRNVMEEMIGAWMSGNEKALVKLLEDGFGTDPILRERAENELLWKRNTRFAKRMQREMAAHPGKTAFFAIGALHLPNEAAPEAVAPKPNAGGDPEGDTANGTKARAPKLGVVELLENRGYTVTRIGAAPRPPVSAGNAAKKSAGK